jgi:thiol-disulfide isomerase/thioredoxin
MRIKFFVIVALVICCSVSFARAGGYQIRVKVNGLKNDTCYLGNYYGKYQYIHDTAIANERGEVVFQGKKPLDGGIYFVVLPKKKFFEIIIDKEQNISFETDTADFTANMKIKGSKQNLAFYQYLNFVNTKQKLYEAYRAKYQKYTSNKDSADYYKDKMSKTDKDVQDYKLNFIKQNPAFLISKVFIASKDPDVPEAPVLQNGRKDSLFTYNYYKAHYFDNMDFSDDRLLRTPVFYNRLNYFMEKVIIQIPDSIIKEADKLVEKGRASKEVFKYLVWYFTYTYETSEIMGFDAIFVHMVDTYYKTNQCFWVSPSTLAALIKRADKLGPILLGKTSPNLVMQDTSLNLQSLHGVKAKYTILLFWDPECGHCQTEVPKMVELYNKDRAELNMEVFAVCTDTNMAKMKSFIRKHKMNWINVNGPRATTPPYAETYDIYSTPVIFILDEKKVIIAKRLGYDKVEDFIRNDKMRREEEKK